MRGPTSRRSEPPALSRPAGLGRFVSIDCQHVRVTPQDASKVWLGLQRGVLTRAQATEWGLSAEAIRHRIRPGGPWQRLLPGVYLTSTGRPAREQILTAAWLYAGSDGIITGPAALKFHRIPGPDRELVDVLVPAAQRRLSCGFVAFHRTSRMPRESYVDRVLRFAPAERAVADAVRGMQGMLGLSDARAVIAGAVQTNRCTAEQLIGELREGPVRGSAQLRAVLAEVVAGIRSVPEAELRQLIVRARLPEPLYNPTLLLGTSFLARPDVWWPDAGVAVEVDSKQWHLLPQDWESTMARHARMAAEGIVVLHISPRQLRENPAATVTNIAGALRAGRPLPHITTRPLAV
jgi:hypothetical protein